MPSGSRLSASRFFTTFRFVALILYSALVSDCAVLRAGSHPIAPGPSAQNVHVIRTQNKDPEPLPQRRSGQDFSGQNPDVTPDRDAIDRKSTESNQRQERKLFLRDAIRMALSHSGRRCPCFAGHKVQSAHCRSATPCQPVQV